MTWRDSSASAKSASRSPAQAMPKRCRQSSSTGSGARKQVPELITVVPPTTLRDRHRDRRPAFGDRQAAVAVELGDRLEVVGRVAVAVVVLAGLEHEHVEPGLGQLRRGDGAAGAGADDDDVAFLALAGAARCRRASRPAPAASRRRGAQQISKPIRSSTCGVTA